MRICRRMRNAIWSNDTGYCRHTLCALCIIFQTIIKQYPTQQTVLDSEYSSISAAKCSRSAARRKWNCDAARATEFIPQSIKRFTRAMAGHQTPHINYVLNSHTLVSNDRRPPHAREDRKIPCSPHILCEN